MHSINDNDMVGIMNAVHGMDRGAGLDIILHTPGGRIAAAETIVNDLKLLFGNDIRTIVPQLAMSAGTLIALSCRSIVMGKQSSIGPIDPQLYHIPAQLIKKEFDEAAAEILQTPNKAAYWQVRLGKFPPTAYYQATLAMDRARTMARDWLLGNMLSLDIDADHKAARIVNELSDHENHKAHDCHITSRRASDLGIVIETLEDDQYLQDTILSIHHAISIMFSNTNAYRLIDTQHARTNILYM